MPEPTMPMPFIVQVPFWCRAGRPRTGRDAPHHVPVPRRPGHGTKVEPGVEGCETTALVAIGRMRAPVRRPLIITGGPWQPPDAISCGLEDSLKNRVGLAVLLSP